MTFDDIALDPLTLRAAEIVLSEMAEINEQQAVEAIKKCIARGYVVPYPPDKPADTPKVVPIRTGPVQPSEAERRMLELEARMRGAA